MGKHTHTHTEKTEQKRSTQRNARVNIDMQVSQSPWQLNKSGSINNITRHKCTRYIYTHTTEQGSAYTHTHTHSGGGLTVDVVGVDVLDGGPADVS